MIKNQVINKAIDYIILNLEKSIINIGLDHGYSSTNYSLVFKDHHDLSPLNYKKLTNNMYYPNPFYKDSITKFKEYDYYNEKVSIKYLNDMKVIYERYIGNYSELKDK